MSGISPLAVLICCAGIGTGMMSVLIPQKRTKRILGFVLGLFILVTLVNGVRSALSGIRFEVLHDAQSALPRYSEEDYTDAVMQHTADQLVKAVDELLREEGVVASDIRLALNLSPDGRITADRIDIYISEDDRGRKNDIRSLIRRHLSKEPHIYVQGQEVE